MGEEMISFGGQEGTFVSVGSGNNLEGGKREERERAAVEFRREDSTNPEEAVVVRALVPV